MRKVEIYTKSTCGYCRLAKALLDQSGIIFEEIDVTFDRDRESEMVNRSGRRTVPQIFISKRPIGGYTDLARIAATMDLKELLVDDDLQSV